MSAKEIEEVGGSVAFGPNTEKAIISLAFDHPDFFSTVGAYLQDKHFHLIETKFVFSLIKKMWEETDYVPPRDMARDRALKELTVDDDYEPILEVIERESDRREIPFIKKEMTNFARDRAFGVLYSEEGISAYETKDYERLETIFNDARKITDVTANGLTFFDDINVIFDKSNRNILTCGFTKIDRMIEGGGPARGEILCWMAPTGVGKSILLPHSGIGCLKRGCNVLHVTLELSTQKTALRYAGAISNVEVHKRFEAANRAKMLQNLERVKNTYKGDLKIFEFPPDEISVDQIYHLITQLRRQWNWHPDVVVIDYLELLISRRESDNVNDYTKQKQVATQLRGLAKNEDVLVFTATQTNRTDPRSKGGVGGGLIGLNRVAESYGKMKPMDYVLSANQEIEEYNSDKPQLRLFFAKNRNGQKNKVVPVSINYKTFRMAEITANKITKK
jgi:replicative DNA helicase